MTVSKDYNKHVYEGNGLAVDWPYDFDLPLTSSGDPDTSLISVYRTNLRGEVSEVTTGYSINAETGTLTYPTSGSPLESGEKLTILRLLDVRQQFFDPSNQANLYPETLEDNTDRLVMMVQQLQEETDRAVKVSLSTDLETEDTTAEGIFEARDIAISAAETAEGYAAQLPAIADELGVNLVTDEADLRAKITAIGASDATLVIATTIPIAEDLTIPSNVALSFKKTGQLQPASGKTLTINGPVDAGLWQIFGGEGTVTGTPQIPYVYPEWFGAVGDGVTDNSAAFTAALAAIDTAESTLYLPAGTYVLGADITIPENVCLKFDKGASLKVADTKTLTVNGSIEAGLWKIFTGDGDTTINSLSISSVYPEWWGAVPDKREESILYNNRALQAAFNTSVSRGRYGASTVVILSTGTYCFDTTLTLNGNVQIKGAGKQATVLKYYGNTTALDANAGALNISDLTITGVPVTATYFDVGTVGIKRQDGVASSVNYEFYNTNVQRFQTLIEGIGYYWKFINCSFSECEHAFYYINQNNLSFFGCYFCRAKIFIAAVGGAGPISCFGCSFEQWTERCFAGLAGLPTLFCTVVGCYFENYPNISTEGTGLSGDFKSIARIFVGKKVTFIGNMVSCKGINRVLFCLPGGDVISIGNIFEVGLTPEKSSTEYLYYFETPNSVCTMDSVIDNGENGEYGQFTTACSVGQPTQYSGYNPI